MDFSRHIGPQQILLNLQVSDKAELLDLMAAALATSPVVLRQSEEVRASIVPGILAREKEGSTGLAHGIAYPHARVRGFSGFALCLATLERPIEYETLDGEPVRLALMAVTPQETPMVGIQTASYFANLMSDAGTRDFLLGEKDPARVYQYLIENQPEIQTVVEARHIMRPLRISVRRETPLRAVAHMMKEECAEAVPVLDDSGRIVGEITADLLLKKGLPEFFNQLSSVTFIRYFDPFEKYFELEAQSKAEDVMSTDFATFAENATLLEIVYLLSVRRYPKIYIVRGDALVGVVDRATVIDRVLSL
jgi:PTS system nitrogen regulatory IIA component